MLSPLPCFYAFCWSAIPTSCYNFNVFILVLTYRVYRLYDNDTDSGAYVICVNLLFMILKISRVLGFSIYWGMVIVMKLNALYHINTITNLEGSYLCTLFVQKIDILCLAWWRQWKYRATEAVAPQRGGLSQWTILSMYVLHHILYFEQG